MVEAVVIGELEKAARLMADPMAASAARLEAFTHCEDFKRQSSPAMGIQCAMALASKVASSTTDPAAIGEAMAVEQLRHFGLKLLEDVVKLRWNEMSAEEKLYVKESAMKFLSNSGRAAHSGCRDLLVEKPYIKDAVARVIVEIAKREWPQNWPGFLTELESACSSGSGSLQNATPTELVMLVLLRLVEDVAVLQNLEQQNQQRRKEISQYLTGQMPVIFTFLLGLMEKHYTAYRNLAIDNNGASATAVGTYDHRKAHSKVCHSVLMTFGAFAEWAPISNVAANDFYLLKVLCHLLADQELREDASDVLYSVVANKTSVKSKKDRAQIVVVLFRPDLLNQMLGSVIQAEQEVQCSTDSFGNRDRAYVFFKKMVQVLAEIGSQVCSAWPATQAQQGQQPASRPVPQEGFTVYLGAMLGFARHPSLVVNQHANVLWGQLSRHTEACRDPAYLEHIRHWVEVALKKLVKMGAPSEEDLDLKLQGERMIDEETLRRRRSCVFYSRMDFETDEEFNSAFGRSKVIILDCLKCGLGVDLVAAYGFCDSWLRSLLAKVSVLPTSRGVTASERNLLVQELIAVPLGIEAVLTKCCEKKQDKELFAPKILGPAVDLLRMCLDCGGPEEDPQISSAVLSSVSALFPIVEATPGALMPVLNKIFTCITTTTTAASNPISNGSSSSTTSQSSRILNLSQDVKDLRRHGCSLLIKIGLKFPHVLLPVFDHLRTTVDQLYSVRQAVQRMEYVNLAEALVLVSNQRENYALQSEFLRALSEPVCQRLRALEPILSDPVALMSHLGLDASSIAPNSETLANNRSELVFCVHFFLAICRRSACPADLSKCHEGGFVDGVDAAAATLRNPAGEVGRVILRHILLLASSLNGLWSPVVRARLAMSKVLDMLDIEKLSLLGGAIGTASSRGGSQGPKEDQDEDNHGQERSDDGSSSSSTSSPSHRLQYTVFELYENVYHLLSQFCVHFGNEFFRQPQLPEAIVASVFQALDHVPDFRLRVVVRTFLKSFVNKCPSSCFSGVLAPVMAPFCPYMLERLTERWKQVAAMRESPSFDEDNTDSAEVLADVVCRQLSREHLDVVKAVLTSGGGSDLVNVENSNFGGGSRSCSRNPSPHASNENIAAARSSSMNSGHVLVLSDLGRLALQSDSLGPPILKTLLSAVLWPDSPSSARATVLLEAIMPVLAKSEMLSSGDASHVMFTILSAIHTMGCHEANYICLSQLAVVGYELLRPRHQSVAEVMAQVPGCDLEDLKRFDAHVMKLHAATASASVANGSGAAASYKPGSDKAVKNMFKKLISQFIGKDVAQMFRKEIIIKNLPALQMVKQKHKTPSLDEVEHNSFGISNLLEESSATSNGAGPNRQKNLPIQPKIS